MQNPTPVREYRPSPAAMQPVRVAIAALFVAIGVALSPSAQAPGLRSCGR